MSAEAEDHDYREVFDKLMQEKYFSQSTNRSKVISRAKAEKIKKVLHNKIPNTQMAQFRWWVKTKKFALVDYPTLGLSGVLCLPVKTEKQATVSPMGVWRAVVCIEDFYDVIKKIHCEKMNHAGQKKTLEEINRHYTALPRSAIDLFIALCPACSRRKSNCAERLQKTVVFGNFANQEEAEEEQELVQLVKDESDEDQQKDEGSSDHGYAVVEESVEYQIPEEDAETHGGEETIQDLEEQSEPWVSETMLLSSANPNETLECQVQKGQSKLEVTEQEKTKEGSVDLQTENLVLSQGQEFVLQSNATGSGMMILQTDKIFLMHKCPKSSSSEGNKQSPNQRTAGQGSCRSSLENDCKSSSEDPTSSSSYQIKATSVVVTAGQVYCSCHRGNYRCGGNPGTATKIKSHSDASTQTERCIILEDDSIASSSCSTQTKQPLTILANTGQTLSNTPKAVSPTVVKHLDRKDSRALSDILSVVQADEGVVSPQEGVTTALSAKPETMSELTQEEVDSAAAQILSVLSTTIVDKVSPGKDSNTKPPVPVKGVNQQSCKEETVSLDKQSSATPEVGLPNVNAKRSRQKDEHIVTMSSQKRKRYN